MRTAMLPTTGADVKAPTANFRSLSFVNQRPAAVGAQADMRGPPTPKRAKQPKSYIYTAQTPAKTPAQSLSTYVWIPVGGLDLRIGGSKCPGLKPLGPQI